MRHHWGIGPGLSFCLFFLEKAFYYAPHTLSMFHWIVRHSLRLDSVSESCKLGLNLFNLSKVCVRQFIACFSLTDFSTCLWKHWSTAHTHTNKHTYSLLPCNALLPSGCQVKALFSRVCLQYEVMALFLLVKWRHCATVSTLVEQGVNEWMKGYGNRTWDLSTITWLIPFWPWLHLHRLKYPVIIHFFKYPVVLFAHVYISPFQYPG